MSSVANSDRFAVPHILVATDFSPASTQAVLQAVAFAKLYGSSFSSPTFFRPMRRAALPMMHGGLDNDWKPNFWWEDSYEE